MKKQYFRKEILESELYQVAHIPHGVKLNQNECPWDIPIDLKARITERLIKTDWNRYPVEDLIFLQKRIAKFHNVTPDQIVVSNGTNTIIQALIGSLPPASRVLILDPTFVVYELQTKLLGHKIIKVPLSEDFELLTEKTVTTIEKENPNLIFIANPNAPTGTLFEKKSLYRILQTAECPVVIDEAYYPFTEETVIDWLKDFDHLIINRTFSKAFALAGVRFGYIIAEHEIAEQVEKFLMPFRLSHITTVIIDEVLNDFGYAKEYVAKIVKERGRIFAELQKLKNLSVFPSEANFLLIRVDDSKKVAQQLIKQGVLIRNVDNGTTLKNCLRVSIGTVEENDAFLAAIKTII